MRRGLATLLAACGGAACSGGPAEGDPAAYVRLLTDPGASVEACLALDDPQLRGDCALAIAGRLVFQGERTWEQACARVPAGPFQDECWFEAAEAMGDDPRSVELCLRSGAFVSACGRHLWERQLRPLVGGRPDASFADMLPAGQRLVDQWRAAMPGTDAARLIWQRFYSLRFEAEPVVRLSDCAGLPTEHRLRCRYAGANAVLHRIWEPLQSPGIAQTFCALDDPRVEAAEEALPQLEAGADPLLHAMLVEQHAALCRPGGALLPHEQSVVGPEALEAALRAAGGPGSGYSPPTAMPAGQSGLDSTRK